jgi:hypothetical protein
VKTVATRIAFRALAVLLAGFITSLSLRTAPVRPAAPVGACLS